MHVIARKRLLDYEKRYPNAKTQLDVWYKIFDKEVPKNYTHTRNLYN